MKKKLNHKHTPHLLGIITGILFVFVFSFTVLQTGDKQGFEISEAATCTVDNLLVNSCRPWVGATATGYTMVASDEVTQQNFANKRLNDPNVLNNPTASVSGTKKLDIVHTYKTNSSTNFSARENYFMDQPNTYLMINYKPDSSTWTTATGGNSTVNSRIDALADSFLSKPNRKFFFTVFHEPENDVSVGNCTSNASGASAGSPSDYVNMWHNVRARFDAKGVNNVVWVMNYMGYVGWDCLVPLLWPGNSYVDWIMYDPYSLGTTTNAGFNDSVGRFYGYLTNNSNSTNNYLSKPWGLAEHGYSNANGNSTQANAINYWNQGATAITNNTYPRLKAYIVFDTTTNGTSQVGMDFSGAVSIAEQTAFNSFADAIFAKEVTAPPPPAGDTTKPVVSITAPNNSSTVSGTITISLNATDNVGITRVDTFWDSTNIIRSATSQNTYGWGTRLNTTNLPDGSHTLSAVAYDAAGNTTTTQISITVQNSSSVPAPTISSFTASPSTLTTGNKSTLSWAVNNSTSCSISPGGPQSTMGLSWQTLTLTNVGSTTYTLTCQNSIGTLVSSTVAVTVTAAQTAPSNVLLNSNVTSVTSGGSALLSWTSSGSSSCTLNPGNFSASGTASSRTITNITSETSFTVTCQNTVGATNSNTVKISIISPTDPIPDPIINSLSVDPNKVSGGQTATIKWSTSNVRSSGCKLDPSPLSSTGGIGSWTTGPLTASISYTLTCVNSDGKSVNGSVSVSVNGASAPAAPAPIAPTFTDSQDLSAEPTITVTASSGQTVVDSQLIDTVTIGDLLSLDVSNITDTDKEATIEKVEFYIGDTLVATSTTSPFALDTSLLEPGTYQVTQRTYFKDGSSTEQSQLLTFVLGANSEALVASSEESNYIIPAIALLLIIALVTVGFFNRKKLGIWSSNLKLKLPNYNKVNSAKVDIDIHGPSIKSNIPSHKPGSVIRPTK